MGSFEIFFIIVYIFFPIFTEAPVSITAIDSEPTINPILAISPVFNLFESSCFPK